MYNRISKFIDRYDILFQNQIFYFKINIANHIAEHHLQTKHQIDWGLCDMYYAFYRLALESWLSNLEQTPLNRSQQLPAPYKRLIDEIKQN